MTRLVRRRRRAPAAGFTAIELAIVLSVAAILVPIVYTFAGYIEDRAVLGHHYLDAAEGVRALAEELRADARAGSPLPGDEVGFARAGCEIRYLVTDRGTLVRDAPQECGGTRGLAWEVESLAGAEGGVEVTFARTLRPSRVQRTAVFVPVEGL